jgi:D-glycerate 3-kinase
MNRADHQVVAALRDLVAGSASLVVLGICGAQGSGKSTLAAALAVELEARGKRCAVLSIDDFYRTRAERKRLASTVHPLCITRGPPGTHDIALALEVLDALQAGRPVRLPRFDKARDDRRAARDWPSAPSHCDVIVFEGWCLGARAQSGEALLQPVNGLEAGQDPDGTWRRYVNAALAGPYQDLFARIDRLVLLAAPGLEVVEGWRLQQEQELRAANGGQGGMDAAQIARFVAHYERITRHVLAEMPGRADLVVWLDAARRVVAMDRSA